jgi:dihydroxy-acid dehydratase
VVLNELRPLLHLDAMTVTGRTLGEELDRLPTRFSQTIVRPLADPLKPNAALVVLRGNLAPLGCILKQSAMSPKLKKHTGRAMVFHNMKDLTERIDDPNLEVDESSV